MTEDKKSDQHPVSDHWPSLAPASKRAVRQSFAEWLAKEYAPPAEIPPELLGLLAQMEEEGKQ